MAPGCLAPLLSFLSALWAWASALAGMPVADDPAHAPLLGPAATSPANPPAPAPPGDDGDDDDDDDDDAEFQFALELSEEESDGAAFSDDDETFGPEH